MKKLNNNTYSLETLENDLIVAVNNAEFNTQALYEARVVYALAELLASKTQQEKLEAIKRYATSAFNLTTEIVNDNFTSITYAPAEISMYPAFDKFPDLKKEKEKYWASTFYDEDDELNPFRTLKEIYELVEKAKTDKSCWAELLEQFRLSLCDIEGFMLSKVKKVAKKYQLEFARFQDTRPENKVYDITKF